MKTRNGRRYFTVILAVVIIVGGMVLKNVFAAQKTPPAQKSASESAINVSVMQVQNEELMTEIEVVGKLNSKNRFDVFTEVTGRLIGGSKPFKEGMQFRKGEAILRLDNTDSRLSSYAQKSSFQSAIVQLLADIKLDYPAEYQNWKDYSTSFNPKADLPELPDVKADGLQSLLTARNIYNQYYSLLAQEAQLRKFTIYAPFSGVVSEATVNPNTLVRAGQKVGVFLDPNAFELEVGVPSGAIQYVKVGSEVVLSKTNEKETFKGVVSRIGKNIDPQTQSAKIYINLSAAGLYEGLYLNGTIKGNQTTNGVKLNSNLLMSDNSLYTVQDSVIKKVFVEVASISNEQVIVTGLKDGTKLVDKPISGAVAGKPAKIVK